GCATGAQRSAPRAARRVARRVVSGALSSGRNAASGGILRRHAPQLRALTVLAAALALPSYAAAGALADAAQRGDAAAVERLLAERADVDAAQPDGATALHWAVYRNDLRLVR